ncbi:MAG: SDR family oxidoreductase [Acinetobacter populi]|jgi:NAD(P)H dehydrogenase (quinone)|uniref:SDR family oxidoreductase n=1 Tax=Acinetobacter populi TaxID=1582270 RepID=UPI002356435D|nr:SDR family oxidoreductase [Acinetobacter populi]MCH4248407.1 SDR family oxidoreductase [Acinetobacter populi]
MRIAITGATGQLGQLVLQQLLQRTEAFNIVALARDLSKAEILNQYGVEIRPFNYDNSPEQLLSSLKDITHLLLISSSEVGKRVAQHQNVIQAAELAGIQLIAYTSLLDADQSPLSLAQEHVATEKLINASHLPYTILRNNWYSENYAMTLPQSIETGAIIGATHHGKISSASRLDYATAAAVILTSDGHQNKIYELAGDNSYTLDDVAQWATEISGKPVVYQDLSEDELKQTLIKVGLPETFADILADADEGVSKGAMYSDRKDLHQLIGRATTPMAETIRTILSQSLS